jgi:ribulose-phosphate 3-epimerase
VLVAGGELAQLVHGAGGVIRAAGARSGMALKPGTAFAPYEGLLPELDMVLVMTVEPGFGGQKFLDMCLPKIRRARAMLDRHGIQTWLQDDGGVSLETIERCAEAGADVFVAGSAVYTADDPDQMVAQLRATAEAAAPQL